MKVFADLNIQDSSLSRIWQHINKSKSFGIISAYRYYNDLDTNQKLQNKLKSKVRKLGYGFIQLKSGWKEENRDDVDYEEALFIPNISQEHIILLGKEFDQYAIVYGDQEQGVNLYCTNKDCSQDTSSCVGCIFKRLSRKFVLSEDTLEGAFSSLKRASKSQRKQNFQLVELSYKEIPSALPVKGLTQNWIKLF